MTKTPSDLARLLNISTPSLRRWCSDFAQYLSPSATPPKGKPRIFSEHDERVLLLIVHLREAGLEKDEIAVRLEMEQKRDWQGLPELPEEFYPSTILSIPADQAASRAYEVAQVAALQTQVQYLQQQTQELNLALQTARGRVAELETELEQLHQEGSTRERQLQEEIVQVERQRQEQVDLARQEQRTRVEQLQVELSQVRSEVARLEGQLSSYSLGRNKPLNVGLLLVLAVMFGVLLVIVVFIVANLLA
jgi:DNA-binding transcriptional MerR regulator